MAEPLGLDRTGPVHAYGLAKQLKIARMIVPMCAGVMSAYGFLVAPPTVDQAHSLPSALVDVDGAASPPSTTR